MDWISFELRRHPSDSLVGSLSRPYLRTQKDLRVSHLKRFLRKKLQQGLELNEDFIRVLQSAKMRTAEGTDRIEKPAGKGKGKGKGKRRGSGEEEEEEIGGRGGRGGGGGGGGGGGSTRTKISTARTGVYIISLDALDGNTYLLDDEMTLHDIRMIYLLGLNPPQNQGEGLGEGGSGRMQRRRNEVEAALRTVREGERGGERDVKEKERKREKERERE